MAADLQPLLAQWRAHLGRRPGVDAGDVDELTDHLLGIVEQLEGVGLAPDEAFLVAVKRLGRQDAVAREFAAEHTGRLWKQLVVGPDAAVSGGGRDVAVMLAFAALAGLAVRLPLGAALAEARTPWLALVVALVGLAAVVAGWFWWLRRPPALGAVAAVVGGLGAALASQALFPFGTTADTRVLALLHLPIALGVLLGVGYLGRHWRVVPRWQEYIRFLGELLIYYVLIALGGGVLLGLMAAMLGLLGLPQGPLLEWVAPLGAGGAVVVAAWLVEAKKSVVENMAPVLTAVFTPLFTLLLVGFLVAMAVTGQTGANREVLVVVDLVLVVVWGLVLFSVASRRDGPPRAGDVLQLALVVAAIAVDLVVLAAIAGRIGEYGASPNKVAALGENVVLLVNLLGTGRLLVGFLRRRRPFAALEGWQARYLPVVGAWASVVVLVLPVAFGFR